MKNFLNISNTKRISILKKYEEGNWLFSQKHPTLPLKIYNYSQKTQYDGKWDDITLNCRGTIFNNKGNLVSKGFSKFFNYEENKTNIPNFIDYVEVWDKIDGSYIGLFYYNDEWIINSKGSFDSPQVLMAKEILSEFNYDVLDKELTYCFELIHPENRIVCDYKDEKSLYFLSAFKQGVEVYFIYPRELQGTIIKFPNLIQLNKFNFENLKKDNTLNKEGYVVKFKNGERCKIKFEEYIRLHRIVTEVSSRDIWEVLKNDGDFEEILDRVPDEFYDWVKETKKDLLETFKNLKTHIMSEYKTINLSLGDCDDKTFALFVKDNMYASYLFKLRKNIDVEEQIWKDIKPKHEKAFQK
jgi:hypothetical protein